MIVNLKFIIPYLCLDKHFQHQNNDQADEEEKTREEIIGEALRKFYLVSYTYVGPFFKSIKTPGLTSSTLTIHVRRCSTLFIYALTLFDVFYPCFAVVDVNYPCSKLFDDNTAQIFDDNVAQNFRRQHCPKFSTETSLKNSIHVFVEKFKIWVMLSSKNSNFDPFCRRKT